MIKIESKRNCTGCGACVLVCQKNAICMKEDQEGFLYPVVNQEKCIQCGACNLVCHMEKKIDKHLSGSEKYYAACLKDVELLDQVSSGGAAWALTEYFIRKKGIVYGAVHEILDSVHHERAETLLEAQRFRKSKYLQSDMRNCYKETYEDLNKGRLVLFTGTPCQIAGLYAYLGKEYENLYTVDIVCHGVPSVSAFRSYVKEMEKKYHSRIKNIVFRDKLYGWNNNHYAIQFENGSIIHEYSETHLFHGAYLRGLLGRPSCGECRYACLPRIADITLADFWKYNGILAENNNNKGMSLMVCNTNKSHELMDKLLEYLDMEEVDSKLAQYSCRHLTKCPIESSKREVFFKLLKRKGYFKAVRVCIPRRKKLFSKINMVRRKLNAKRRK